MGSLNMVSLNVVGELFIDGYDRYEVAVAGLLEAESLVVAAHESVSHLLPFEHRHPLHQGQLLLNALQLLLAAFLVVAQGLVLDVQPHQGNRDSADFFEEEGEVGAKILNKI